MPVGEPGYTVAGELDRESYFQAFENLVPIYNGLRKLGVDTDFKDDQVFFDEEGNVTAMFDFGDRAGLPGQNTDSEVPFGLVYEWVVRGESKFRYDLLDKLGLQYDEDYDELSWR